MRVVPFKLAQLGKEWGILRCACKEQCICRVVDTEILIEEDLHACSVEGELFGCMNQGRSG